MKLKNGIFGIEFGFFSVSIEISIFKCLFLSQISCLYFWCLILSEFNFQQASHEMGKFKGEFRNFFWDEKI